MSRTERRKQKRKFIINIVAILIIAVCIIYLEIKIKNEKKIEEKNNDYKAKLVVLEDSEEKENVEEVKYYPKEYVEENYKGYKVIAKLEIPKIDLKTLVIDYSEQALNISATKFWGCSPNEIGNFCIAGHNFKNKNMFHNLKELELGDTLWVKDNKVGCIEYVIYDIYTVLPSDTRCLSQNTDGDREVTLITCTSDSKKRIIIKAKEIIS